MVEAEDKADNREVETKNKTDFKTWTDLFFPSACCGNTFIQTNYIY